MVSGKHERNILKFDVGADGFKKMMIVLGITAIAVLIIGIYFLNVVVKDIRQL